VSAEPSFFHNPRRRRSALQRGIAVEREHADVFNAIMQGRIRRPSELYAMIARAHLRERPDYYERLAEMERS
jgi:hypothetical protein